MAVNLNFEKEEALIDRYVESKSENQDVLPESEEIASELIREFLLPQKRFEEARSWCAALPTKQIRDKLTKEIKDAARNSPAISILRLPQNRTWAETSAEEAAIATEDQQYHYDRTMSFMNIEEILIEHVEDIIICRNEWITFQARVFYEALHEKGAEFDTMAMAVSDYIEFFLIPNHNAPEDEPEITLQTVGQVLGSNNDLYRTIQNDGNIRDALDFGFLGLFGTVSEQRNGRKESLLFTDQGILLIPKNGLAIGFIPIDSVTNLEIGSEDHIEHQGFGSTEIFYWIVTINTNQWSSYSRWIRLGSSESEINQNRGIVGPIFQQISLYYTLTEGQDWQSSGGYQTSIGFGWIF